MGAVHVLASECAIVAAAVWLALAGYLFVSAPAKVMRAAVESLKSVAAVFLFVSLIYASVQYWIATIIDPTSVTTANVKTIESAIFELNRVIVPLLVLDDWTKLGLLAIFVGLLLFGAAPTAGLLSIGLVRYAKIASRMSLVITAFASFSFFQSQVNNNAEAEIARLRSSLDEMGDAAIVLKRQAEETALELVIEEVIDAPPIQDVLKHSARLTAFERSWAAHEERSRSLLLDHFPKRSANARLKFHKAAIAGFHKAQQNISQSTDAVAPTPKSTEAVPPPPNRQNLKPTDSIAFFQNRLEILKQISESIPPTLVENTGDSPHLIQDLVRHALKMGYKSSIGANLESVLVGGVDGIPAELVKLVLTPAILEPIQTIVTSTVDKLLWHLAQRVRPNDGHLTKASAQTISSEIQQRINYQLRSAVAALDVDATRKQVNRFDSAVDAVLQRGKAAQQDLVGTEKQAAEVALMELRSKILKKPATMWDTKFQHRAVNSMRRILDSVDAEFALQRLAEYRLVSGDTKISLTNMLALDAKYARGNDLAELHKEQGELREEKDRARREEAARVAKEQRAKAAAEAAAALVRKERAKAAAEAAAALVRKERAKTQALRRLLKEYWSILNRPNNNFVNDPFGLNKQSDQSNLGILIKPQRDDLKFNFTNRNFMLNKQTEQSELATHRSLRVDAFARAFLEKNDLIESGENVIREFIEKEESTLRTNNTHKKDNTDILFGLIMSDISNAADESERGLLRELLVILAYQIGVRPHFNQLRKFADSRLSKGRAAASAEDILSGNYVPAWKREFDREMKEIRMKIRQRPPPPRVRRSDKRLKTSIKPVGILLRGLRFYRFRFRNEQQCYVGLMAQDLLKDPQYRQAVTVDRGGYYLVDYGALGFRMATCEEWDEHHFESIRIPN